MRTRLFTWPRIFLAAALAVLAGAGVWLSTAGTGRLGQSPAPGAQALPSASAGATSHPDLAALPTAGPTPHPASCGSPSLGGVSGAWLPDWLDDPNRLSLITSQASRLGLLDFAWLRLGSAPGSVMLQPGNPGASSLRTVLDAAAAANPCGWRFVTIIDEQTPKAVLAQILLDPQARWRNVVALATAMADYPQADGLTLDYEYALPRSQQDLDTYASVAHWRGLSVREETGRITAGYTEFVRELALAMHRQHRALRVAVMVRPNDEIDYTDPSSLAPFLYDYGELARYADQIVLMAIDFHWSTGDPGPIVTLSDLRSVLSDVQTYHIPAARLAIESPVYGYDWTVDRAGRRLADVPAETITATNLAARTWAKTGTKDGETSYEYTAAGQRHIVWFGGTGLNYQVAQLRRLCPGCAVMAWATGNADPAGSDLILQALGSLLRVESCGGKVTQGTSGGRLPGEEVPDGSHDLGGPLRLRIVTRPLDDCQAGMGDLGRQLAQALRREHEIVPFRDHHGRHRDLVEAGHDRPALSVRAPVSQAWAFSGLPAGGDWFSPCFLIAAWFRTGGPGVKVERPADERP